MLEVPNIGISNRSFLARWPLTSQILLHKVSSPSPEIRGETFSSKTGSLPLLHLTPRVVTHVPHSPPPNYFKMHLHLILAWFSSLNSLGLDKVQMPHLTPLTRCWLNAKLSDSVFRGQAPSFAPNFCFVHSLTHEIFTEHTALEHKYLSRCQ